MRHECSNFLNLGQTTRFFTRFLETRKHKKILKREARRRFRHTIRCTKGAIHCPETKAGKPRAEEKETATWNISPFQKSWSWGERKLFLFNLIFFSILWHFSNITNFTQYWKTLKIIPVYHAEYLTSFLKFLWQSSCSLPALSWKFQNKVCSSLSNAYTLPKYLYQNEWFLKLYFPSTGVF